MLWNFQLQENCDIWPIAKEIILTLPPTSPFERCLGTDLYALSSNLANGLFRNQELLSFSQSGTHCEFFLSHDC